MTAATIDKEKTKETPDEKPWTASLEDEDVVTVILRNWGMPLLPLDKTTYLDRYTGVGGVFRNVRYGDTKRYIKLGLVAHGHVFPNTAQADAFAKATGRNPLEPANLAAAIQTMTPEKVAAILGDEAAMQLAMAVQRLISSRKKEGD